MRSPPGKGSTALPGVHKVWKPLAGGRWARIWYAWRGGGPQIARFEGASKAEIIAQESSVAGAARVAEGYAAASAPRVDTTTLAGILTAWEASDAFKRRSDSTKRVERRAAEAIRVSRIGSLPARALPVQRTKRIIRDWLGDVAGANGPRAADTRKDVLSKALNWGKGEGLCAGNPAEGIADFHFSDRSDIIWTAADIAAFEAAARAARAKIRNAASPEPNEPPPVVLALLLACYTGLRCEDLCGLAWRDVGPNAITVRPLKAVRRRRTALKKAPPPVVIPRTPELNAILAQLKPDDDANRPWVLFNSYGRKWKPAGLSDAVGRVRNAAQIAHEDGRAKRLHDARGTFVTHMRCSGFETGEVAEMVGWETEDVERVAKKYADAERIALAWLERLKRAAATA